MAQDQNALVWLDMEMTGLNPDGDRIIEIAMVVTDTQLNTIAESPSWVVHQSDAVLDGMATFARTSYANVHRGVYTLAEEATAAYEGARSKMPCWMAWTSGTRTRMAAPA